MNNALNFTSSAGQKREIYFNQFVLNTAKTFFSFSQLGKAFKTNFMAIFPLKSKSIFLILRTKEDSKAAKS
jgi:hypothetical protein